MIKALKVVMIVYGVLGILFGLGFIFMPEQMGATFGFEKGPAYVPYFLVGLGTSMIAPSIFLIVAARDPLQNILWVKFAILWGALSAVGALYCILRGFVNFGQAGMGFIIDAVFTVLFLAFYPWRGASSSD